MTIAARDRLLTDWFAKVQNRSLVLPRFQRHEAWTDANVVQLFNTVLNGLPVGAMLILEIGNEEPFLSRTIEGGPTSGERVTEHLLDGQQRLTALWRGLHNNYPYRTYYLVLDMEAEPEERFRVESLARWKKDNDTELRPFWANKTAELWNRGMIPLDLFRPGDAAGKALKAWLKEAIPTADAREDVSDLLHEVRTVIATYNIPYLSLPPQTKKETALSVFIKMNTSAAPLSTYDIVVAQVEASMGESLHDLVAKTREKCPDIEHYYSVEDLTLYAGALLQDRAPMESNYLHTDFGKRLLDNWNRYLQGVARTVTFLQEERIFDRDRLPSEVVVPVLVALWADAPERGDAEGNARTILRKYLWRSFFTKRYERTTNSRALVDATELKALLQKEPVQPVIFNNAEFPLPEVGELEVAGWPKRKDRLGRAILAVSLRKGGLDLADGSQVSRSNLPRREYHHVFPNARLQRKGYDDNQIFRALNCALVTWSTNRNISDKEPERYLAERRDGSDLGEAEIRSRLATHLISFDDMMTGDYEEFLKRRAEAIHAAMIRLCAGEALL